MSSRLVIDIVLLFFVFLFCFLKQDGHENGNFTHARQVLFHKATCSDVVINCYHQLIRT